MSLARRLLFAAPVVFAPLARAQVQLEWDRSVQIPLPERLVMGEARPDASGGWYVAGGRAVLFLFPGSPGFWVVNTPLLLRLDGQGLVTSVQDLAPAGTVSEVPVIEVDATGGIVTTSSPTSMSISRLDAAGSTLWSALYPPGVDMIAKFGFTPGGEVHAGGYETNVSPILSVAGWDQNGASTFSSTLPNPDQQVAICATSAAGDFAIASASNLVNPGTVAVFGPTGSLAWSATVPVGTEIGALRFTPSGGLVSAGDLHAGTSTRAQVLTWDAAGAPGWSWTTSYPTRFLDVDVAPDGFVACAGYAVPPAGAGKLGFVVMLDASGIEVLVRVWSAIPGQSDDSFRHVIFRSTGEIVAAGEAYLTGATSNPLLQGAPAIASWHRDGAFAWQYVGPSLHNVEECTSLTETPAGSIVCASKSTSYSGTQAIPGGGRLVSLRQVGEPYCFGDGSGTACPCGNDSAAGAGEGCQSSLNVGALLAAHGRSSLANDTLVLDGSQMTNSSCLYFQGTARQSGGAGAVFGDGLRCTAGTITRLRTKSNVAGASAYPESGEPSVSVKGGVSAAGSRTYQVWYRNASAFCTSSTFNLTNGLEITWIP